MIGYKPNRDEYSRLVTVRVVELKDVVPLLRAEVQRAGSVTAWCKKTGVNRTVASKVLNNLKPPTKSVIKALQLRTVFVASEN